MRSLSEFQQAYSNCANSILQSERKMISEVLKQKGITKEKKVQDIEKALCKSSIRLIFSEIEKNKLKKSKQKIKGKDERQKQKRKEKSKEIRNEETSDKTDIVVKEANNNDGNVNSNEMLGYGYSSVSELTLS